MMNLAFDGANVTAPGGVTYVDVPTVTRQPDQLIITLDDAVIRVTVVSSWAEGQRGYGFTDDQGQTWKVKRARSGCCGG